MTKLILSIDFDFFVKEDPELDIGHGDSQLFNEALWAIREESWQAHGKTAKEILPMVGHPCGLAYHITKRFTIPATTGYAESHLAIIDY
ncbi:MAG TPA: hypothetical protein VNU68_04470, partial [Verrucomicrobiae bacterium]|nr:hypothetical protein [Verrucomicrobiae bacterium]